MNTRAKAVFWLLTVLMLAVMALFLRLALWQYHRAQEHATLLQAYAAARQGGAQPLPAAGVAQLPPYAHVFARGQYDGNRQIVLIERPQPDGPAVGADVVTPLRMPGGRILLVNRGWVRANPQGHTRAVLAPPAGTVQVSGYLADLFRAGVRLAGPSAARKQWPKYLLYPRWKDLDAFYGSGLQHRILWLGPNEPGGYDRAWRFSPAHGPDENYGYMAQWIGLAVTVFIVWLVLTLRASRRFQGESRR